MGPIQRAVTAAVTAGHDDAWTCYWAHQTKPGFSYLEPMKGELLAAIMAGDKSGSSRYTFDRKDRWNFDGLMKFGGRTDKAFIGAEVIL